MTGAVAALAVALIGLVAPARAGFVTLQVTVDDPPGAPAFAFTPDSISTAVDMDSRVHWERGVDGDARHSIRQNAGLFHLRPTLGVIDFTRDFSAGRFPYYCEIHGSPGRGMDGVVRVAPGSDLDPEPVLAFTVEWAQEESRDTGGLFDVRYRRQGATRWTIWKNDTRGFEAVFGASDRPVRVVAGRSYEFQARSMKIRDPDKRSGWSPVLVVTP